MNYQKHYNLLIVRAKQRASSKKEANKILGYSEAHHIIPRCIGGLDTKENIAHLTPEEHYVAHQLLIKIYPKQIGLVNAVAKISMRYVPGAFVAYGNLHGCRSLPG